MASTKVSRARADTLLVELGFASTRAKAQAMILAGEVFVDETQIAKAAELVSKPESIRIAKRRRFVSRGGDKLHGALTAFGKSFDSLEGMVVLDIGAATGGFTDCVLSRGAAFVYAVDVGYGQLDAKLRADPRVESRERTNARELTSSDFQRQIDLVVLDASFIGIEKLAPAIADVLARGRDVVALIKPQFEVGRRIASENRGVIRDASQRAEGIAKGRNALITVGFDVVQEVDSVLPGPKGNVERFLWARRR